MTISLYCDEDTVRHALVAALRQRGVDVRTALDAQMIQATDDEQLISNFKSEISNLKSEINPLLASRQPPAPASQQLSTVNQQPTTNHTGRLAGFS